MAGRDLLRAELRLMRLLRGSPTQLPEVEVLRKGLDTFSLFYRAIIRSAGGASIFRTETPGAPYVYGEVGGTMPPRPCDRTLEPREDSASSSLTISVVNYGCLWRFFPVPAR